MLVGKRRRFRFAHCVRGGMVRAEGCGKEKRRAVVMEVSASSQTHKLRDAVCSIPSSSIRSILRQAAGAGEFPFIPLLWRGARRAGWFGRGARRAG